MSVDNYTVVVKLASDRYQVLHGLMSDEGAADVEAEFDNLEVAFAYASNINAEYGTSYIDGEAG